ncbi:MAG TPA: hypothetical protein VK698_22775 [Kofleriaceae bacterium]|nr:hypothetical protein [Kofleriaceae bacterium]
MRIDKLPVELQISAAVAVKAQSVQRQMGQAAVQLIEGAGVLAPSSSGDGRGTIINTRA